MNYKSRSLIIIVGMLLAIGTAVILKLISYPARSNSSTAGAGAAVQTADSFVGGTFEASGIAHITGTNAFLFVDDARPSEVLWMQLDGNGKQAGSIKPVKLGITIEDPEGITTDGSYFYIAGSLARSKSANEIGMARFKFNRDTQSAEDVQSISEVKQFLVENVAELRSLSSSKPKDNGISIEGIAWDPARKALLLGLRSPVIDGNALLIPLKMRDLRGPFSADNLEAGKIEAIRLPIGGMGIRSIEYDQRLKLFQIIAGATEGEEKTDFQLWHWSGTADGSGLREITTFDKKLQPEGVTSASVGDSSFTVIVFDTSRYLKMR